MLEKATHSDLDLSDLVSRAGKAESILIQRITHSGFQIVRDTLQLLQDLRRNNGIHDSQSQAFSDWLDRSRDKPKVLDLYSGSCAVGTTCEEMGFRALTIDMTQRNGNAKPVLLIDALKWPFEPVRRDLAHFM